MKKVLIVLGIVTGIILSLIIFGLFFYDNGYSGFNYMKPSPIADEKRNYGTKSTIYFPAVDENKIEGWLYKSKIKNSPLIIMAPGLSSTKEDLLEPFAWKFVENGFSVLLFDYRCFGGSEGFPRHWVDIGRHAQDYESAITYAKKSLAQYCNTNKIILWGSSFSGGTVIITAARLGDEISAVIAQVAFIDTAEEQTPLSSHMWKYIPWTTLDMFRSSLNLEPIYTPIFGKPGEFAFTRSKENPTVKNYLKKDDEQSQFWSLIPEKHRGGWENKMLARIFADIDKYIPMNFIDKIKSPIYFVAAEKDEMTPVRYIRKAYDNVLHSQKEIKTYDCGHYEVYFGTIFKENINSQIIFLKKYVK